MSIPPRIAGGLYAQTTFFARRIQGPARAFIHREGASGRLLLLAAVIALVWANSPWADAYERLWSHHVSVDLGFVQIDEDLRHWVNDALMALFFFLVTLEVKREILRGELSSRQKAALPVAGAIGGMVVPAALFLAFNAGTEHAHGWGIPMATDIAFAIGALAVVAKGAPAGLVTFLLALAVVDDIGAIAVIAVFYTEQIALLPALLAVGLVGVVLVAQAIGLRAISAYWVIGVLLWLAVLESGVHATIAGVLLGALTPSRPILDIRNFREYSLPLIERIEERSEAHNPDAEYALGELELLVRETESPLERLEHTIHPWSGYFVLPLFALANAGVPLDVDAMEGALSSSVTQGIFVGLFVGKPLGIVLAAFLAVRLGWASLPLNVTWGQVVGVGVLAGIGFSVSIFITDLAFEGAVADQAKMGILAATALAALTAFPILRFLGPNRHPEVAPAP